MDLAVGFINVQDRTLRRPYYDVIMWNNPRLPRAVCDDRYWLRHADLDAFIGGLDSRSVPDICPILRAYLTVTRLPAGAVTITSHLGQQHRWSVDIREGNDGYTAAGSDETSTQAASAGVITPVAVGGHTVATVQLAARRLRRTPTHLPVTVLGPFMDLTRTAIDVYELTMQQRSSLNQVADARDRAATELDQIRHQLERNLHDGAQNELVSMQFLTATLTGLHPLVAPQEANRVMEQLTTRLNGVERSLAHAAAGALPPMLHSGGLAAAVQAAYASNGRVQFSAAAPVEPARRYPAELEAAAMYVCFEAINNALQHGSAGPIRVTISHGYEGLLIEIADSGPGLPPGVIPKSIVHLRRRAEAVGGIVRITTSTSGTVVSASFPL